MFLKGMLKKPSPSREKGFTLIEMLVVLLVLGALVAVVVPNVASFLEQANLTAANMEAMTVKTAAIFVLASTGEFPHSSDELYGGEVDYLSNKPDGTYFFDRTTGLIESATPSPDGITKGLQWNREKQSWYSP